MRTVVREYLDAFIVAGLVALFLITFVVRTFYIPSGSMEPTLQIHDVLLVNEFEYRFVQPHHGDIVVFKPPVESSNDFIKRLIGKPGDTLRIHNGIVFRDGVPLNEPYEAQKPNYELEVKNYDIYVDGSRLGPATREHPAEVDMASGESDSRRILFHDGRQSEQLRRFSHLGLRATSRTLRCRPARA